MRLILFLALRCWGAGESLPIEDFTKPGAVQAVQQAFDDRFSVRGGTVTGPFIVRSDGASVILSTDPVINSVELDGTTGRLTISSSVMVLEGMSVGSIFNGTEGSINLSGALYGNGIKGMILGGMYCVATGTTASGSNNPLTGAQTCPSGYSSVTIFATGGLKNMSDSQQTIDCVLCYRAP